MSIKSNPDNNQATIIDVRTVEEFRGGHVAGSINIPLQELPSRTAELKKMTPPIVLCCASGNRSGIAEQLLSREGISCYNGGSWLEVNAEQSKTIK